MHSKKPKGLEDSDFSQVEYLFSDIDDTLTADGELPSHSYAALWRLYDAGYKVIPVTGRPAGWCEMIARMWPVHGVIGENGGFYFRKTDENMKRVYDQSAPIREENLIKLKNLQQKIKKSHSRIELASDQFCRQLDLAIDICEDIEPSLSKEEVRSIVSICEAEGASVKVSSIHINTWYGQFNKAKMAKRYLKEELSLDLSLESTQKACVFIGDSPNDEPLFEAFQNSVAVANIGEFLEDLIHPPKFMTEDESAAGFMELAVELMSFCE